MKPNNNKFSSDSNGCQLDVPNETGFMDEATIAATQSGHRLKAYLLRLTSAFHRDLRSTCDTFELLMHHYFDSCEFGDEGNDISDVRGKGGIGTKKSSSPSLRLLENPDSLARLHEYLIVVRFLLIQTNASLLTTMDNIVIIKASADAYKQDKQEEASRVRK
jgi:hypothetical protein